MIASKTVFIVGAGASAELGFPVGSQLTWQIANYLEANAEHDPFSPNSFGDEIMRQAVMGLCTPNNTPRFRAYQRAAQQIQAAMPIAMSIDNFLHTHRENKDIVTVAKLAICRSILDAEHKSSLYVDPRNIYNIPNLASTTLTWYTKLWYNLSTGLDRTSVLSIFENVSFVIFNYDRCVEQFLFEALKVYFLLSFEEACAIMAKLKVWHPYGQVGTHISSRHPSNTIFGGDVHGSTVAGIAGSVKTFTERVEEGVELTAMRAEIASAKKLVFLGFAYHQINMDLLTPGIETSVTKVYGTKYGMSDADALIIESRIKRMMSVVYKRTGAGLIPETRNRVFDMELSNTKCSTLFDEYSQSIGS